MSSSTDIIKNAFGLAFKAVIMATCGLVVWIFLDLKELVSEQKGDIKALGKEMQEVGKSMIRVEGRVVILEHDMQRFEQSGKYK